MTTGETMINLTIEMSGLILCAMAILQVIVGAKVDKRTEGYFISFYSNLMLLSASNIAGMLMRGMPGKGYRIALYVSNYLEFLLPNLMIFLVTSYLIYIINPEGGKKWLWLWLSGLLILDILILTISQFTGLFYIIDADNIYRRQTFFSFSFLIPFLMMLTAFLLLTRNRDRLTRKERMAFWIYYILPTVAIVLQSLQYGINFTIYSTIIAGLAMYVYIVSDHTERYYIEKERNEKLQVEIMLSQIQPHFLYNSLGAIRHLCRNDPEAREAISKFSRYLRGNMDSLGQNEPIPFSKELEHTRTYLELEQLRFGDELRVTYDLQYTDFLLPTLTLQPLVENAVRYGVRCKEDGAGTVTISSREMTDHIEISVADDGPGFPTAGIADADSGSSTAGIVDAGSGFPTAGIVDAGSGFSIDGTADVGLGFSTAKAADVGRSHIGLENVRERLDRVSGGKLVIASVRGRGTCVTILLPKEGEKNADIRHR